MSNARTQPLPRAFLLAASILFITGNAVPAFAAESAQAVDASGVAPGEPAVLAPVPVTITLLMNGREVTFATEAKTFGEILAERGATVSADDYLSDDVSARLFDGMRLEYRPAVGLSVRLGSRTVRVRTSALTLEEALANARLAIGPHDTIVPDRRSLPQANELVRVIRVNEWTEHNVRSIVRATVYRADATLALGRTRLLRAGTTGIVETTKHFVRRGAVTVRTALSRRTVRVARARIIERGTFVAPLGASLAAAEPLARFARSGISSAMQFAHTVLHVIATAYTAGCFKCSGVTANGMRAGFGVIAVDPHLIPLGSKVMIPGYGRAIAGDTGGAIVGNRVDLGMNRIADAVRFGRRAMTVYVLK